MRNTMTALQKRKIKGVAQDRLLEMGIDCTSTNSAELKLFSTNPIVKTIFDKVVGISYKGTNEKRVEYLITLTTKGLRKLIVAYEEHITKVRSII